MEVIDCPLDSFHLTRILLSGSLDEDSVPKTQVNVPPLLSMTPPEEQPGSADVGIPDPLYDWNISAHPFVPESELFHAVLSGIDTQHPEILP